MGITIPKIIKITPAVKKLYRHTTEKTADQKENAIKIKFEHTLIQIIKTDQSPAVWELKEDMLELSSIVKRPKHIILP